MDVGTIIAIVVVVILVIALIALLVPRLRNKARERELEARRGQVVDHHRTEAQQRSARAEIAEQKAHRERAEAELHESRARLHEEGLADDELESGEALAGGPGQDRAGREHAGRGRGRGEYEAGYEDAEADHAGRGSADGRRETFVDGPGPDRRDEPTGAGVEPDDGTRRR